MTTLLPLQKIPFPSHPSHSTAKQRLLTHVAGLLHNSAAFTTQGKAQTMTLHTGAWAFGRVADWNHWGMIVESLYIYIVQYIYICKIV